jgi:glycerophosphoryl diester phosphodiesterase
VVAALAVAPAAAAATPAIHAHRGGALAFGKPVVPENSMPAFRNAAVIGGTSGFWLELDAVVSSDGVPFVIHDSTLDRTTNCAGAVTATPAATIDACRIDKLGVSETLVDAPSEPVVRVPRLTEVLAFAKERELPVNIEIKNIPGDPGYVPGDPAFATAVTETIKAAGLDPAKVIIQSFDPTNLDTARTVLPGVRTSFLTLAQANEVDPAFAAIRGYEWVSPGGIPSAAFFAQNSSFGLKVVPYTLDTPAEVQAAAAAGVEALITDDVPMARRALGLPDLPLPSPPAATPASLRVLYTTIGRALRLNGIALRLVAGGPARARISLRLRRLVVARGTISLGAAGGRTARIRLTAAGRRALARRRVARLTVTATINGRRAGVRAVTLRRL